MLFNFFKFSFLLLISFSASAFEPSAFKKIRKLSFVNGCRIYNFTGMWVKTIPGSFCLFTNDGSVISADEKFIRKFNKLREVVWQIPGHFHHQINFSSDGKNILALSSEILKENETELRYDTFLIISMDGKIIHRQSSKELLSQMKQKSYPAKMTGSLKTLFSTEVEASHFNSFYEIPEINTKKVPDYIRKGNVIVNSIEHGTYILTPDLKTVLKLEIFDPVQHLIHDVQVRSNGHYLLFNNRADDGYSIMTKYSSVQEINPVTKQVTFEFTGNPKTIFYSPFCGGVQDIDDDLLGISHVMNGLYIYSRTSKTIVASIPGFTANDQVFYPSQQIKAYDLEDFIKNWDN